jgi:hypothetical protein
LYLRFILPGKDSDSGVEAGIFQAAYALAREGETSATERQELAELLGWFEAELITPTASTGHRRKAISGAPRKELPGSRMPRWST